jgi:hydrogenase maturation protein HypF
VEQQVQQQINTPLTSSCGRMFDAVSALIGVCSITTFEAQAAIALELAARQADIECVSAYPFTGSDNGVLRVTPMLAAMVEDLLRGRPTSEIAAAFHITLVEMFHQVTLSVREQAGLNTVALSGGVFQNRLFLRLMREKLNASDFEILTHEQVPANDGGLSLGQAVIALNRRQS